MSAGVRHILCGVDGSPAACLAATRAAELAVALEAELTFVAVAREAPTDASIRAYMAVEGIEGEPMPLLTADAEACLSAALSTSSAKGHTNTKRIVRVGKVSATLIAVAEEIGADTLVIGRHRHSGIRRALVGSVSQEIADQSSHMIISVCC